MKKELRKKYYDFFLRDNGGLAMEQDKNIADWWLDEIETILESILDMTDCPHERGKLKEQLELWK